MKSVWRRTACSWLMATNWTPMPSPGVTFLTNAELRISPSGTENSRVMEAPTGGGVLVSMNKPPIFRSRARETFCDSSCCQDTQTPFGVEMRG